MTMRRIFSGITLSLKAKTQRLTFCALLGATLLLSGCILSDTPVLVERERASALNIFADKTPDISGTYKNEKGETTVFARVERSDNAYIMIEGSGKPQYALIAALPAKNTFLLQFYDDGDIAQYVLFPMVLDKGNMILCAFDDDDDFFALCKKHNLQYKSGGFEIRQGSMTFEQYSKAAMALASDMIASKAYKPFSQTQRVGDAKAATDAQIKDAELRLPVNIEARKAEEAARRAEAEAARKAEEARRAEEVRLAEEARKAEEARIAEESRIAEEARRVEEARMLKELGFIAMSESTMTWTEAKAYCQQFGGRLPLIGDKEYSNVPSGTPIEGFGAVGGIWPSGLPKSPYWTGTDSTSYGFSWFARDSDGVVSVNSSGRFNTARAVCVP